MLQIDGFPLHAKKRNAEIKIIICAARMKNIGDIFSLDDDAESQRLLAVSEQSKKTLLIALIHKKLTLAGKKYGWQTLVLRS